MSHHAYLIMAHENSLVLRTLISLLDDERNDIFIHIDTKTDLNFEDTIFSCVQKSRLYFTSKRVDVIWANISQVEAEYILFDDAYKKGKYEYFHLLSGADLPLKSQDEIHRFFKNNEGKEFIGFAKKAIASRIKYIHLFAKSYRNPNKIIDYTRRLFILFQTYLRYNHFSAHKNLEIKNGTNWVSVTRDFVGYLLENENLILSKMKYSKSPDEYYKQTLAYNSKFREHVFSIDDEFKSCMRLIDWGRGKPYEWQLEDLDEIMGSGKLFVRKINKENAELVRCIEESILKHNG
ncbi:beta-1,6-N-acetylglucosaminyltransferase [Pedobacter sp. WC2501]|uniref:beta-1,6-N-acetylglucosaminyltransferase n=1 Tax=Pedobacter sp. WC2501 TaxID=3461400 RepID=UPI004045B27D